MGQEGMAPLPPPPIPPYMNTMDTAWMHPPPPFSDGKAMMVPDTASQAESKLRQVMGVLKKNETELPPDVAQVLKDTTVKDGKMKIKGMHEAVEVLGKAHATLEQACHERAQNLATWRQFLHQSVQRWREYTERFQQQEQVNLTAIGQAREDLKQAQKVFKELQEKGIITIDAEDDPATMDSEMVKEESSMKIQVGLKHLTKSLQDFAQQADQEHAEEQEQMKKRPRKDEPFGPQTEVPLGAAPASTSGTLPSMQPFWQGSQYVTSLYGCGKPAWSDECFAPGLGLRHSVHWEGDFVSQLEARECAIDLEFELGIQPIQRDWIDQSEASQPCANLFQAVEIFQEPHRSVHFAEEVQILFGPDETLQMIELQFHHDALSAWRGKPWGKFNRPWVWASEAYKKIHSLPTLVWGCLEPQSEEAVLIRQKHYPKLKQNRLTDAWHSPLPPEVQGTEGQPDEDPDVIPDPTLAPDFVHDICELADAHRVFTNLDSDGEMRIRTWYVHHVDLRSNLHPRSLGS